MAKLDFSATKIGMPAKMELDPSDLDELDAKGVCIKIKEWRNKALIDKNIIDEPIFRFNRYYEPSFWLEGTRLETDLEFAARQQKIQKIENQKAAKTSKEQLEKEKKITKLQQDAEKLGYTLIQKTKKS